MTASRRRLLGLSGAVAGLAVLPAWAEGPDAELIRLAADLLRIGEETKRLDASPASYAHGKSAEYLAYEAEATRVDDAWWSTADRLRDLPAATHAGLRAKADGLRLVLERCIPNVGQTLADVAERGDAEDRFALALARDVLAMGA